MEDKSTFGFTDYHERYLAEQLGLKRKSSGLESVLNSINASRIDLNPHQIDAALFALQSPLSKGVILADEVGLGKTIEAGIIISQYWAMGDQNILVIVPSSLRTQWKEELYEKFGFESVVIDKASMEKAEKNGESLFSKPGVIKICSYHFASSQKEAIEKINWDLVVMDEAHKLRNVYKPSNKIANNLKEALQNKKKLLLTATPLQNNMMELYGLISIIDEQVFADASVFKNNYMKNGLNEDKVDRDIRERIEDLCKRTLRSQVNKYISYTSRIPMVRSYRPGKKEQKLYDNLSSYLQREEIFAFSSKQRPLMSLILRKILASSTAAIIGTLHAMISRMEKLLDALDNEDKAVVLEMKLDEEFGSDQEALPAKEIRRKKELQELKAKRANIEQELNFLKDNLSLAMEIEQDAKTDELLVALKAGFKEMERLNANRKAVIFTESRRTQDYLFRVLSENGYKGKILLLNGENNDKLSREIYHSWSRKASTQNVRSGSRITDRKAAIIDAFEHDDYEILIGTEAASEGINLQFCSLVINYDLPWNPQRIEQRIGRCHRYGQKNDVVVINFINENNQADKRVYELLDSKFKLFSGVFGSSDEVLGNIEDGVDFEKKVFNIYQNAKTKKQIEEQFAKLQDEFKEDIDSGILKARRSIMENLDEEVLARLNLETEQSRAIRDTQDIWTRNFLNIHGAKLDENDPEIVELPESLDSQKLALHADGAQDGMDVLSREAGYFQDWIDESRKKANRPVVIEFDGSNASLPFLKKGTQEGLVSISKVHHQGFSDFEQMVISAMGKSGQILEEKDVDLLFQLPARIVDEEFIETPRFVKHAEKKMGQAIEDLDKQDKKVLDKEEKKIGRFKEDLYTRLEIDQEKTRNSLIRKSKDYNKNIMEFSFKEAKQKHAELNRLKSHYLRSLLSNEKEKEKIDQDIEKQIENLHAGHQSYNESEEIMRFRYRIV